MRHLFVVLKFSSGSFHANVSLKIWPKWDPPLLRSPLSNLLLAAIGAKLIGLLVASRSVSRAFLMCGMTLVFKALSFQIIHKYLQEYFYSNIVDQLCWNTDYTWQATFKWYLSTSRCSASNPRCVWLGKMWTTVSLYSNWPFSDTQMERSSRDQWTLTPIYITSLVLSIEIKLFKCSYAVNVVKLLWVWFNYCEHDSIAVSVIQFLWVWFNCNEHDSIVSVIQLLRVWFQMSKNRSAKTHVTAGSRKKNCEHDSILGNIIGGLERRKTKMIWCFNLHIILRSAFI